MEPLPEPLPEPEVEPPERVETAGSVGSLSEDERVLARLNAIGPEFKCWTSVASSAEEPGLVLPYAQMMVFPTLES